MASRVKRYFLEIKDFSKTVDLNLPENFKIILDDKDNFHLNRFFYKQIGVDHYWMWVHTCSLDHKHALQNYKSKGFEIFKEEEIDFVA